MSDIVVDTYKLNRHAQSLESVISKINRLDYRVETLYTQTGLVDLYTMLQSNAIAGYNWCLSRCQSYLQQTASDFEETEKLLQSEDPATFKEPSSAWSSSSSIQTESYKLEQNEEFVELTPEETDALISQVAEENGVSKKNLMEYIKNGLSPLDTFASNLDEKTKKIDKVAKLISGATNLAFTVKGGKVILSGFARKGLLNNLVKYANGGTGIGTIYNPGTLLSKRVLGPLFAIDRVATVVDNVATVVGALGTVFEGRSKIAEVLSDDTKSTEKKICDVVAIEATTAVGVALDVAAPIAGKAVTTAVAALIPIPGVNVVAGVVAGTVVKDVIGTVSEVVTSEAVVNQVSDAIENVGSAVVSGVNAVSDAGKALLESKNVGEAVSNAAELVGTAAKAYVEVVHTALAETAKTAVTVVTETVKSVGKKVVNFFKGW